MNFFSTALIAALLVAPNAYGQPASPSLPPSGAVNMDLAAADAIRSALGDEFDDGHVAMLHALGHQQAVASTCAGFAIDPQAFSSEFDMVYDDKQGKPRTLPASQRAELERKATLAFGMAFGAQIAIAASDHNAFCLAASQERASGKVGHLVWAK